jgi:hypothetical protein
VVGLAFGRIGVLAPERVRRTYSVITSVMDELRDPIESMLSTFESIDSKHDQMQEDLKLIKNEFYLANLRSFASKVKDAFVRLQAAVDARVDINDDAVCYHIW